MENYLGTLNIETVRIDHIAIAVASIDRIKHVYTLLGGVEGVREIVVEQGVDTLPINFGGTRIELLEPLSDESPVGKFIRKRGEGLHHVAFQVSDLVKSIAECVEKGMKPLDRTPRNGADGRLIAFLDPRTSGGVLIELTQVVEEL